MKADKKKHKKALKKLKKAEKKRQKSLGKLKDALAELTSGNLEHLFRELPSGDPQGYAEEELVLPGLEYNEKAQ